MDFRSETLLPQNIKEIRKYVDCYYYYYSKCTKENCQYRHEPTALGCEVTCPAFITGKCTNIHCVLRHMELEKDRSKIPCFWEDQPNGCIKMFCAFKHKKRKVVDARRPLVTPVPILQVCQQPSTSQGLPYQSPVVYIDTNRVQNYQYHLF